MGKADGLERFPRLQATRQRGPGKQCMGEETEARLRHRFVDRADQRVLDRRLGTDVLEERFALVILLLLELVHKHAA